jgi:ketosteroid isomerase-like protein
MRYVLLLLLVALPLSAQTPARDETTVREIGRAFHEGLTKGDSAAVLALLHPEVVIFEGGWESLEDYRKGHLRADMRASQALKQETTRDVITISGDLALITREYSTSGTMGERTVDSIGVETMVLLRTQNGWKIRHIHWSSRPRRRPGS